MGIRSIQFGLVAAILGIAAGAFAQESEYQAKMQEDLDYYKPQMVNNCGVAEGISITYAGKLGGNPRVRDKDDNPGPSLQCSEAIEAVIYSCQTNAPVKKVMSKLKAVVCTKAPGPLGYKLAGTNLTLTIDPTFKPDKKASGTPKDRLVAKIKNDLDK